MQSNLLKLLCAIGLSLLLVDCGTTMSGRLEGTQYVSRSGDLACSFGRLTRDVIVADYAGEDGEWVSTNLAGVDIERVERFAFGKGAVGRVTDASALADALLPSYMAKSERVKGAEVILRKRVTLGARDGVFTLVAFDTFTRENYPPHRREIRGILWLVGEKYGTAIHAYNWRYTDGDADKIETRVLGLNQRCSFRY